MWTNAELSNDGLYRHSLRQTWKFNGREVCFIMLNPSTADAVNNDPTIRRCMRFAESWGYTGIIVVNLFDLRATDPKELLRSPQPCSNVNDEYICKACNDAAFVIAAWGTRGNINGRANRVIELIQDNEVYCLGITKNGSPKHPLYLPSKTQPIAFNFNTKDN